MSTRTPARPAKRSTAGKSARASGRVPTQPQPQPDPSQDADPQRDPRCISTANCPSSTSLPVWARAGRRGARCSNDCDLCISCTNLDDSSRPCRHRASGAGFRHAAGARTAFPANPAQTHPRPRRRLVDGQYRCWNEVLRPALNEAGVRVLHRQTGTRGRPLAARYFREEIMPVLSPLGLDPAHPFPKILNKSLNIVVVLKARMRSAAPAISPSCVRAAIAAAHHPVARPRPAANTTSCPVRGAVGVRR